MKIKFNDIAINSVAKKKPVPEDAEHYIGLEHIDSGSFKISRWGSAVAPIGDKLLMKKGDVLFGKRRAYQRKVAIAPFDGIFSAHGMVLRPKTDVVDERYFPFFIASDQFMDEAVRISVGGLSPTINWKTLKECEFDLPPIEEQRALAAKLWAANDLKEKYQNLLAATDEMLKAKFREMFPFDQKNWPLLGFDDFAVIDATMTTDYEKYADFPHIGIDSIESGSGELRGYRTVREDHVISGKYVFGPQHIIYSKIRPNMNKVALPDFEGLCSADSYPILVKSNCDRHFLAYVLRSSLFLDYIVPMSSRSNMPKVNREQISGFKMKLPPIELQREFVVIAKAAEASKAELKKSTASIDAVMRGLINS